ncbi:hypothetical protein EF847_04695 [Actinobacteria bacterium YIM 96077]|uniref:Integral membrane protein n=2 Tax=Phytoactinopolyspora halophila TaxID=1981511 RepID=A0A329R331_9ACTN|nr:hypothetical protein EF847_04695 [Actinobacteria bacterium YIM 96077]RAW18951.1 hypothetical protein DPM12_00820 [Phytoactinopolyspora halophila]
MGRTVPIHRTPLLRWALAVDGAVSAVNGLIYVALAAAVGGLLGLPATLLVPVGAFLILYGAGLAVMSGRSRLRALAVLAVVELNAIWVVASLVVAATGWFDPSTIGVVWIVLQAAVVAGFAVAQLAGLRRARAGA